MPSLLPWYNTEHRHTGPGLLTPHDVHYALAEVRVAARADTLAAAHAAHPELFPAACPNLRRALRPSINPPEARATAEALLH